MADRSPDTEAAERLERYFEKRDFTRTPEPREAGEPEGLALRYSMQKHDATRTHFDLRLEWKGVLLSWAVTKGPSFQTSPKRLAVRTEDHPVSYLDFEGAIPKDNYGAGTVMLWDIGHWRPLEPLETGLKKGHIHFALHGRRLTGGWHLVRMGGKKPGDRGKENWLLIKEDDEAAGERDPVRRYRRSVASNRTFREIAGDAEPLPLVERAKSRPRFRKLQLATLGDSLVDGVDWWHELKFDGYRALVALGKAGPKVYTRNGHDWTDKFASLLPDLAALDGDSALIDGEIVAGAGLSGFSTLQKAIKAGGPFTYYAFDLLERDGTDLTSEPLTDRRAALEEIFKPVPPLGPVQLSPVIEQNAAEALEAICEARGEGLIAKRKDARYRAGRGRDWIKVKCTRRDEFVVVGWQASDKKGRPFASLVLGAHDDGALTYVGKVGTGFDGDLMEDLAAAMKPLARKTAPVELPAADARGVTWITPKLVAEVTYSEFTADGRVRHAVFEGLREDKPAKAVKLGGDTMQEEGRIDVAGISVSHPERVVYPKAKITKRQVAEFYEAIADRMLEGCADRPLSLVRLPTGLEGERFFQKHAGTGFPDALKTVEIEEKDGGKEPYMYATDAAGLVAAAQMGTLEFHIWGSKRDRLDQPDRMVFDLDPDEGLGFKEVKRAAVELRDRLDDLGLPSWPMVTGGKGVHVVVPLRRVAEWETVKLYARIFATLVAREEPERYLAEASKAKRKGRIFIDWLRNQRGATAIAPFSLRAREGAPAAVPVSWADLQTLKSAQAFPLEAALERNWTDLTLPKPVGLSQKLIDRLEKAAGG